MTLSTVGCEITSRLVVKFFQLLQLRTLLSESHLHTSFFLKRKSLQITSCVKNFSGWQLHKSMTENSGSRKCLPITLMKRQKNICKCCRGEIVDVYSKGNFPGCRNNDDIADKKKLLGENENVNSKSRDDHSTNVNESSFCRRCKANKS